MPNIQIKNVSDHAHRVYRRRAANAGQSLQEYMRDMLERQAAQSTWDDIFDHLSAVGGGSHMTGGEIARLIREDRESH